MLKFNFRLETVNLDDKIWHLLVADIELDKANAMKQQLLHNEIMPPIIEKQKFLEANKRSVYQLLDLIKKTLGGVPKTSRYSQKSHANMFPKKVHPSLSGRFEISNNMLQLESDKNLNSLYFWAGSL